jgi:hypothetical protein
MSDEWQGDPRQQDGAPDPVDVVKIEDGVTTVIARGVMPYEVADFIARLPAGNYEAVPADE